MHIHKSRKYEWTGLAEKLGFGLLTNPDSIIWKKSTSILMLWSKDA